MMAAHLNGSPNPSWRAGTKTLETIAKSSNFTSKLPSDSEYPTPKSSHDTAREQLGPRLVKGALYTFVRPENTSRPELLGVSDAALSDLNISAEDSKTEEFKQTVAGNLMSSYDEDKHEGVYPWAQCYGGYQFGQWAGQLGDGRAISLFETTNEHSGKRYELQLKGAGKTPYSRFADGKAVLRSSIREFIVSEALNALRIPTTRALSLILAPDSKVRREKMEPGAIVCRFAESWLRIGTFDLLRARNDRENLRKLAQYVAEDVFGGWETLPAKLLSKDGDNIEASDDVKRGAGSTSSHTGTKPSAVIDGAQALNVKTGVPRDTIEGEGKFAENRFQRLYREICRRNARTVALWQAYAFTNGVLNTDNTSIYGLSMDFGPFAFLDNFDPTYTPNHDDHMLRYSYRNQPTIIWWNLLRLGEALGELIGAGEWCDDTEFATEGVREARAKELVERAETLIAAAGEEYKAVFMQEYKQAMATRLGLKQLKASDFDDLFSEWLDAMEAYELDFNQSFRKLSSLSISDLASDEARQNVATIFFRTGETPDEAGRERIGKWLEKWRIRLLEDWSENQDEERQSAMRNVNPRFIPKSWILDELIDRVERKGEREILDNIMKMALRPFDEQWGFDQEEEERFCGDVPRTKQAMQCSCSS